MTQPKGMIIGVIGSGNMSTTRALLKFMEGDESMTKTNDVNGDKKIAEIRNKSEVGRIVRVQANTVHDLMADIRFLLSELELMSEENRKLREERDEDKKYIEDLDNYRRKLEGQLQSEQQEIERLNEELLHAK